MQRTLAELDVTTPRSCLPARVHRLQPLTRKKLQLYSAAAFVVRPISDDGSVEVHPWQWTSSQNSGTSKANPPTTNTKTKWRFYRTPGVSQTPCTSEPAVAGVPAGRRSRIFPSFTESTRRPRSCWRLCDGCASEGRHHHISEGRQRSAGLPHHKNE